MLQTSAGGNLVKETLWTKAENFIGALPPPRRAAGPARQAGSHDAPRVQASLRSAHAKGTHCDEPCRSASASPKNAPHFITRPPAQAVRAVAVRPVEHDAHCDARGRGVRPPGSPPHRTRVRLGHHTSGRPSSILMPDAKTTWMHSSWQATAPPCSHASKTVMPTCLQNGVHLYINSSTQQLTHALMRHGH